MSHNSSLRQCNEHLLIQSTTKARMSHCMVFSLQNAFHLFVDTMTIKIIFIVEYNLFLNIKRKSVILSVQVLKKANGTL